MKEKLLNFLNFIGVLTPYKQLSTDTVLLIAVIIKFLTIAEPDFATIPAIVALIASRVHKRYQTAKTDDKKIKELLEKTEERLKETAARAISAEREAEALRIREENLSKTNSKLGSWGR